LADGIDGALIETGAKTALKPDVPDRAVAPHDDFELDVAADPATAGVLGIVGFHFAKQRWRRDAAAWPKWSSARSAS
jgi:hypothetical protein